MSELADATPETLAVIAALRGMAPKGHRVAVNELDYGWVIAVGGSPNYRTAIVQQLGIQVARMVDVGDLAAWLFDAVPPENVFAQRAAEAKRWQTPLDRGMSCRTCRYWGGPVVSDGGRCGKIVGPDNDGLALAWFVGSGRLATMGDFSCSYWRDIPAPRVASLDPASSHTAQLLEYVRHDVARSLGARVTTVRVDLRDHGAAVTVSIVTPEGWRHAVTLNDAIPVNDRVSAAACEALTAWLDAKDADAAKRFNA